MNDVRRPFAAALVLVLLAPSAAGLATSIKAVGVVSEGTRPGADLLGVTGAGVLVAVLDTGVDDHPSLQGAFVAGVDLSNGVGPNPLVADPDDTDGHGTHVANILLGRGGGGASRGVAPGARLVDVKVATDLASLSLGGLELGLEWVLDYNSDELRDPIQVVSLSLGTLTPGEQDPAESRIAGLVEDLATSGVVVVAAAGNCGPGGDPTCRRASNGITSPGSAEAAITVAAVDDRGTPATADDTVAVFSSRGPGGATAFAAAKPDVAAPGANITSADAGGGTRTVSGTSQATPHVSGIVALMLEARPGLTPGQVKEALQATASHPAAWDAATGYGVVDAYDAVRHARGPPDNVPPVASIAYVPPAVANGTRVVFSGNASRDPDGLGVTHRWNVTGRPDATTAWVAYVLDAPGVVTARLVATDADGATHEASVQVTVEGPSDPGPVEPPPDDEEEPEPEAPANDTTTPVARFTVTPPTALVNETVAFDATASTDDVGVVSWAWDFTGDGVPDANGRTVQRLFATPGVVLVTLEVADAAGNTARAERALVVSPRPDDTVAMDAAPPSVAIASPVRGDRVVAPVRVEWSATDDVGVVETALLVDGARELVAPAGARDLVLDLGAHTLRVEASDASGKTASAQVVFLVVEPIEENGTDSPLPGPGTGTPGAGVAFVLAALALGARRVRRR